MKMHTTQSSTTDYRWSFLHLFSCTDFQPSCKIWEFLPQFHKDQRVPFPSIPGHLHRVPSPAVTYITAAAVLFSSKLPGRRMDWDHPWTNHRSVPISSAFHHSGLISIIWFLFIHIACSHTHSCHTFKKVTKNVKCFYNPAKPYLLLQPPASFTVLLLNKHKQLQKI